MLFFALLALQSDDVKINSLADYTRCADERSYQLDRCIDGLRAWLKKQPQQALPAAKEVRRTANHWVSLQFFDMVKLDKKLCADPDLSLAVISGLGLPESYPALGIAKKLFNQCWEELQAAVAKEITSPEGYLAMNTCSLYAAKKIAVEGCKPKAPEPVAAPTPWTALDPAKTSVEPVVKVFAGSEGKRITFARVKGDATAVLVKLEGVRGPWNGKVILHRERESGTGYDYYTQAEGAEWVTIVARRRYGGELGYELYPKGDKGPFMLGYDDSASKAASATAVLDEFRKK